MSKYFAHLKSEVETLIYANGTYLGVASKRNSIDMEVDTNNVYLNVSPVGNYLPYTVHIFSHNNMVDISNNCLIVPFYNNNYDIYLKSIKIQENIQTKTLFNQSIGKCTIVILNGTSSSINIYENGNIVYSDNLKLLNKAQASIVNNNLVVKGYTTTNEYYLLILNNEYELIFNGYFDNLDENENTFIGFTNIFDIAKHGHICEIDLNDTKNIKDYYVVKDGGKVCEIDELIPQAFLEALKVKNFTLAKSYLSPTLAKASNKHFETYFGNISEIYFNCYNNSNPINYTIYNGEYKFYNFNVNNKKIIEIEECSK